MLNTAFEVSPLRGDTSRSAFHTTNMECFLSLTKSASVALKCLYDAGAGKEFEPDRLQVIAVVHVGQ